MVMPRKTFETLHVGNSIAIIGRPSDPSVVANDYAAFRDLAAFMKARAAVPVFFKGKDGKLEFDIQPVRKLPARTPAGPTG